MKGIALVGFALVCSLSGTGQGIQASWQLAYGAWSSPLLGQELKNNAAEWISGSHARQPVIHSDGVFQLGVNLRLLRLSLGVTGSYEQVLGSGTQKAGGSGFEVRSNFWTLQGQLKWDYFRISLLHIYGGFGLGLSHESDRILESPGGQAPPGGTSIMSRGLAYQLTLLGLSLGNRFGVFTELGYGYLGLWRAGVQIPF